MIMRARHQLRARAVGPLLRLPPHVLRRMSGGTICIDGRTLDAQAQMFIWLARLASKHVGDMSPAQAREQMDESVFIAGPLRPMRATEDFDLGKGLRARWYLPPDVGDRAPLIVYFHGGGFVAGSIASHDRSVRVLADEARACALSVEYRLSPEHKFPAPVEDAVRAYLWARENATRLRADPDRIALAGDSAGGNLAAVVSRIARDERMPMPRLQVPLYPATDLTRSLASHRTFGEGFFLEKRSMDMYLGHYAADPHDERASPLLAKSLDGLPEAIVVTAGFDPLVDEGDAYAARLVQAGTRVVHVRHDSLIHGFVSMIGIIDAAHAATVAIGHGIRDAFAGEHT